MSETLPPVTLIKSRKIMLDIDNPRYGHLELTSNSKTSEEALQKEIESEGGTITLYKSIKRTGVEDPIRVQETGDGKYVVFEGNRRTTCLRAILSEDRIPPEGVSYDSLIANVIDPSVSELEIKLQKARLQSGKSSVSDAKIDEWLESIVKNMEVSN